MNGDFVVWVCGVKGDVDGGVHDVGPRREGELEDVDLLEGELRLVWTEDDPYGE